MLFFSKLRQTFLLFLILTCLTSTVFATEKNSALTPLHLTGHVEFVNSEGGFFAIIGDDGQKYQPTNLPHKLRINGLPIKFDAQINDNIVSTFMWGTIVDIANVAPLTATKISNDERSAIYVLLKRLDAFNHKDLAALKLIDTLAKNLTTEQFNNWTSNYNNYTLQYVEISAADSYSLTGSFYYTRELIGEILPQGNTELAALNFTISKTKTGWKLTELETLKKPNFINSETLLKELKQKALEKYKTDRLANLLQ